MGLLLKSLLGILGGIAQGVGSWMISYAGKENTKARELSNEIKQKDNFNETLAKEDLAETQRRLSADAPK